MVWENVFCDTFVVSESTFVLLETHYGPHLRRRNYGSQISHAHEIVGGTGKSKNPVYFTHPAMPYLAQKRDRLQPAETFLDLLSLSLTDGIARVPCCAVINGAPAAPCKV